MIAVSYINLIYACIGDFACGRGMPSLNHILLFDGYDRLVIASYLFWVGFLVVFAGVIA
jgi:hypothetical protein